MNKYLLKIAELNSDNVGTALVEAAGGGYLLSKVPDKLLGYHNLYHGTSIDRAEKILKEGFDPSKGGSGAAAYSGNSDYMKESARKVHVTKNKGTARFFARFITEAEKGVTDKAELLQKSISSMFNPFSNHGGKIIKMRVSDNAWRNYFEPDPDMGNDKFNAARTAKGISTKSILGHKDNKGIRQFLNLKNLRNYWSTSYGKIRGGAGAVLGTVGLGLIGHAGTKLMKKDKE